MAKCSFRDEHFAPNTLNALHPLLHLFHPPPSPTFQLKSSQSPIRLQHTTESHPAHLYEQLELDREILVDRGEALADECEDGKGEAVLWGREGVSQLVVGSI